MKYAESNVTGDAGEYYFAYFITHALGWPCRLLDIDIGIDAQIEILDDDSCSTGQFLAVQIKGTRKDDKLSLDVAKKHVKYWLSMDVPVLLALVDVDNRKVYVKSIRVNGGDPLPNTRGQNYKFKFGASDLLSVSQAKELRLLAYAPEVRRIEEMLGQAKSKCVEIIKDCNMENGFKVEDYDHYLDFIIDMQDVGSQLFNCKQSVLKIRSQVGDCGYTDAYRLFKQARSDMSYFFSRAQYPIHSPAEMKVFDEDYFSKNAILELGG
ncbi:DUF4365 domain-containing protein [Pseudomonas sp. KCJK8927]|uniref:DUF4365 domain-containing protein n=1 Tax=Pseudomonas sp. KCJK8927 TaxID=3344560 RepID=UPI0039057942